MLGSAPGRTVAGIGNARREGGGIAGRNPGGTGRADASGLSAGITIVASIILAAGIGYGLGYVIGIAVPLALVGAAVGLVIGFYVIYLQFFKQP